MEYELGGIRHALRSRKPPLGVSFLAIGVGSKHSPQVLRKFLDRYPEWDHVFIVGLSGAISRELRAGDWLTPVSVTNGRETIQTKRETRDTEYENKKIKKAGFYTSNKILKPAEKSEISQRYPDCQAVDMESFELVRLLESRRVPYSVLRVVLDEADFVFPDFRIIFSEKKMNGLGLLATLLSHPLKALAIVRYKILLKKSLKELTQLTILSIENHENT